MTDIADEGPIMDEQDHIDALKTKNESLVKRNGELTKRNTELKEADINHTNHIADLEKEITDLRHRLGATQDARSAADLKIKDLEAKAAAWESKGTLSEDAIEMAKIATGTKELPADASEIIRLQTERISRLEEDLKKAKESRTHYADQVSQFNKEKEVILTRFDQLEKSYAALAEDERECNERLIKSLQVANILSGLALIEAREAFARVHGEDALPDE